MRSLSDVWLLVEYDPGYISHREKHTGKNWAAVLTATFPGKKARLTATFPSSMPRLCIGSLVRAIRSKEGITGKLLHAYRLSLPASTIERLVTGCLGIEVLAGKNRKWSLMLC